MRKIGSAFIAVGLFTLCCSSAEAVNPAPLETYVAKSGTDAGNCSSATSPCLTLTYALGETAAKGQISILGGGVYNESLTIAQSVRLESQNGEAVILATSGNPGITFNGATTDKLNLSHVEISGNAGGTYGIVFNSGNQLGFFHGSIFGFADVGIEFVPNNSDNSNSQLYVEDSFVRNNTGGHILVKPAGATPAIALFSHTAITSSSSYGLRVDGTGGTGGITAVFSDSHANWGSTNNITAVGGSGSVSLMLERAVVTYSNGYCVNANGSNAFIGVSNSTIGDCMAGALNTLNSGNLASYGNNVILGGGSFTYHPSLQ